MAALAIWHNLNRSAALEHEIGNYPKAARLFAAAGREAESLSEPAYYESNYAASFVSLLALFESSDDSEDALDEVEAALDELDDVESTYRSKIRKEFISNRRLSSLGYEFSDERDGVFLEKIMRQKLIRLTMIRAALLYYQGHFLRERQSQPSPRVLARSQGYFKRAVKLLTASIEELEKLREKQQQNAAYVRIITRARYNLGRFYFAGGSLYAAQDVLERAVEEAYEFNLIPEEILSRLLLVDVLQELYQVYGLEKYKQGLYSHFHLLADTFFSNPHYYSNLRRAGQAIGKTLAGHYLKKKENGQALQALERSWAMYLQDHYFRYPIVFEDDKLSQRLYDLIRKKKEELLHWEEEEYKLRVGRQDTQIVERKKRVLRKEISQALRLLQKAKPAHYAFLSDIGYDSGHNGKNSLALSSKDFLKNFPKLRQGQFAMRFFVHSDAVFCWCFTGQNNLAKNLVARKRAAARLLSQSFLRDKERQTERFAFLSISPKKVAYQNEINLLLKKCLRTQGIRQAQVQGSSKAQEKKQNPGVANVLDVFFVIPKELAHIDFNALLKQINPRLPKPTFASRLSGDFLGRASQEADFFINEKTKHVRVLGGGLALQPIIKNYVKPAIVKLSHVELSPLMTAQWTTYGSPSGAQIQRLFESKYLFKQNQTAALAVLYPEDVKRLSYHSIALLYEILRLHGLSGLAILSQEKSMQEVRMMAGKDGIGFSSRTFGFSGFDHRKNSSPFILKKYKLSLQRALQAEKQKEYEKAQKHYQQAAAYLAWSSEQSQEIAKLSLALMRMEILLEPSLNKTPLIRQSSKVRRHVEEMIGQAQKQSFQRQNNSDDNDRDRDRGRDFVSQVYKTLSLSLLLRGDELSQSKYLERCLKYFSLQPQKCYSGEESHAVRMQRHLKKSRYGATVKERRSFTQDFQRAQQHLYGDKDVVENLIKHGQYELAQSLLQVSAEKPLPQGQSQEKEARKNNLGYLEGGRLVLAAKEQGSSFTDEKASWKERLQLVLLFDQVLLGLRMNEDWSKSPLFRTAKKEKHLYLEMLLAAWLSDWQRYESLSQKIQKQHRPQKFLQRRELYRQWRNFLQGYNVNLENVLDKKALRIKSKDKKPAVFPFTWALLERSLIYHLLVNTLALDAYSENAYLLQLFIKQEGQKFSYNRAALMALGAAKAYVLNQGDFQRAHHFLNLYHELIRHAIPEKKIRDEAARLQLLLEAADLSVGVLPSEKKEYERGRKLVLQGEEGWKRILLREVRKAFLSKTARLNWRPFARVLQGLIEKQALGQAARKNIDIILTLLQRKAAYKENWSALVNLDFLRQALRNYQLGLAKKDGQGQGASQDAPIYENWVEEMKKKLPASQSLSGLIDLGEQAFRFLFANGNFQIYRLEVSGYYLRAHLHRYLRDLYERDVSIRLNPEVSRIYQLVAPQNKRSLNYIWLSGIHSLAPLEPKVNERLFQIMDIETLLTQPACQSDKARTNNLWPINVGKRRLLMENDTDRQARRVYSMEKLSLEQQRQRKPRDGKLTEGLPFGKEQKIHHIFADLNTENFLSFAYNTKRMKVRGQLGEQPWFLTSNFLGLQKQGHISKYNYVLSDLARHWSKPGVVNLGMPVELGHAYFVRYFYQDSSTNPSLAERFVRAYFQYQRNTSKLYQIRKDFPYRLVTPCFLQEEPN